MIVIKWRSAAVVQTSKQASSAKTLGIWEESRATKSDFGQSQKTKGDLLPKKHTIANFLYFGTLRGAALHCNMGKSRRKVVTVKPVNTEADWDEVFARKVNKIFV